MGGGLRVAQFMHLKNNHQRTQTFKSTARKASFSSTLLHFLETPNKKINKKCVGERGKRLPWIRTGAGEADYRAGLGVGVGGFDVFASLSLGCGDG